MIWLKTNQETVNALNVYPIPDGDTGTNMVLTMEAAWKEVEIAGGRSIGKALQALAHGAQMGARGNSGVILSQLWRGFAKALDGVDEMDPAAFTKALAAARDTAIEPDQTFTVDLSNESTNATIADNQGLGTIQKDDLVQISIDDVTQDETDSGTTTFSFTVSIDQADPDNDVTVDWASADGTATLADSDYTADSGTLTFPAGTAILSQSVDIDVTGDAAVEPDETFNVDLSNQSANATISDNLGLGTITNDDAPTADAGGPYAIAEGDSVDLDASASSDPNSDPLTFAWDLNNDSVYGDVTGETPTVTWATLVSFGIDDDGSYPISVDPGDDSRQQHTAYALDHRRGYD